MGRPTLCVEMSEFADGVAKRGIELQPGKTRRDVVVGGPKELGSGEGGAVKRKTHIREGWNTAANYSRLRQKISKIYTSTLSDCLMLRG